MIVRFEKREELAPTIWEYFFRPERAVDFVPGQYAEFHIPGVNDSRGPMRTFTLTSLPIDEFVSFIVKCVEPYSAYKQALQSLEPGAALKMTDTMGDLVLPKSPDLPLVFVAGGIGIASYASMLKKLMAEKEQRPIYLFYALRSRYERILSSLMRTYPLELNQVVIAPNHLSAQEIKDSTPPHALIYLSGSQRFVETLRTNLYVLGTPREQIVFDYYDGYAEL